MDKKKLIYEGKAKKIFSCADERLCIMEYKDSATAFNGEKRAEFEHKSDLNCRIAGIIFEMLEKRGIRTHFVRNLDDITVLVKRVDIVPLEVIVRNIAAGSFSKRYGVEEGTRLKTPSFEFSYKNDTLNDPMINISQVLAIGLAEIKDMDRILEMAEKINNILIPFFASANLILVDFKLEFGIYNGEMLLADEITPDTCRLWDAQTMDKLDKDRFRRDMGGLMDAYREVYDRLSKIKS